MKVLMSVLVLALPPAWSSAGDSVSAESEFYALERATLEETLNVNTSVSSLKELPLRETPGLVTVLTGEEIRASGARDLVDVLSMVPEFEFGADGWGQLGLAVRGNWANEGKVLLLWDGQVYNEPLYTNIQYDRFPVDQIEEVQIVKGPGSVLYGGYAELAVISVKTRSAKNLSGSEFYAGYGQARARARGYAGYSYGKELPGGAEVTAKAFLGEARRSDRRYTDLNGASYNMNGTSDLRPRSLNLHAAKKGLSLRFISDHYAATDGDQYGEIRSSGPGKISYNSTSAEAKYAWRVSDFLRLEPRLNYYEGKPWHEDSRYDVFDKRARRVTGALTAFYDPAPAASFTAGGEYFSDSVKIGEGSSDGYFYSDGSFAEKYYNAAFFGQGVFRLGRLTLAGGGRYDKHSNYGASFVPRLAAAALWDRFSLKAIYSRSFRAPSIENMRVNPDLSPEKTSSTELEAGYEVTDRLFFSGNVFQVRIEDPIVYFSDDVTETYTNYDRTGTAGFGLGSKYKRGALRADLNYLRYSSYHNRVASYSVPGHGSYMLGLPRNKLTLAVSVPAGRGVSVNPSAVYISRRYGYAYPGGIKAFDEEVTAALNLQLKDRPLKGLTLGLGVRDMFNAGHEYIQAYTSGHAPLPGQGREFFLRAAYEF